VGSVLLLLPLVLRDLDDCGLQIFLLAMASAAAWALVQGQPTRAGFWLGSAAAYKLTPMLFLPLLIWKRQWRAAGFMVAFFCIWQVVPAVWLGWDMTVQSHQKFLAWTVRHAQTDGPYPSLMESEAPKQHNLCLQAMLARYLVTYPSDHPLYLDHAAFLQFGNLPPDVAKRVMQGMLLCLAAVLAWRFRRRWEPTYAGLPAEWAVACLLCALLAPLCWKHHLVVALPGVFLVLHAGLATGRWGWGRIAALVFVGVVVLGTRHTLLGRELSVVLLSYKLLTMAMLAILALTLNTGRSSTQSAAAPRGATTAVPRRLAAPAAVSRQAA
jgi:hypothetical protein